MQDNKLLHWIETRGVTRDVIESFNISIHNHYDMGECIKIPVENTGLSKYRRDPDQDIKPKYTADKGLKATLYGWNQAKQHKKILVTEGELDTLVAWSNNIPAVSSTAGALTFNDEWVDWLSDKEVILCFDNDKTGAEGMVRILKRIPHAKVVLIPQRPNIKDITDYVQHGGNLHELIKTARTYTSIEEIKDERSAKISVFESVIFHDEYLEALTPKTIPNSRSTTKSARNDVELVKQYPIESLLEIKHKKTKCIWHNEKTPSLAYYPKTNTVYCFGCGKYGDVIDVYRQIYNCDFKTAVNELKRLI